MTVLALVTGSLFRASQHRTSKNGRQFVAATIRVKDGDESQFIRLAAFSDTTQTELTRLAEGDCLSVQGPLTASIYTAADGNAKVSLSIVASNVLALRQLKESKAKAAAPDTRSRQARLAGSWSAASGDPNDEILFGGEA